MASTNKTPNLGLNQWVLDDPLLMEDVNTDNQKIDTAVAGLQGQLGAMPYVKLFDITTTADAEQVDLDLSDLDLSQFAKLEIYAYLYRHIKRPIITVQGDTVVSSWHRLLSIHIAIFVLPGHNDHGPYVCIGVAGVFDLHIGFRSPA